MKKIALSLLIICLCWIITSCEPRRFRFNEEINSIKEIKYIQYNDRLPILKCSKEIEQAESNIKIACVDVLATLEEEKKDSFLKELSDIQFWGPYSFWNEKYPDVPFGCGVQLILADGSFYLLTHYYTPDIIEGSQSYGRIDLYDENGIFLRHCAEMSYEYDFESLMLKYFDNYKAILPDLTTSSN